MTKTEYIRRTRSGRVERKTENNSKIYFAYYPLPLSDARWGGSFDELETDVCLSDYTMIATGNMYSDEIGNGTSVVYSDEGANIAETILCKISIYDVGEGASPSIDGMVIHNPFLHGAGVSDVIICWKDLAHIQASSISEYAMLYVNPFGFEKVAVSSFSNPSSSNLVSLGSIDVKDVGTAK